MNVYLEAHTGRVFAHAGCFKETLSYQPSLSGDCNWNNGSNGLLGDFFNYTCCNFDPETVFSISAETD